MAARFKDLCLDAGDHQALAEWWCTAMGYVRKDVKEARPLEWPVPIVDPAGNGPLIWVIPVPEKKTIKNRMHFDVYGDLDDLEALGATVVEHQEEWVVMADPEGNEFCVFDPR
jgi:hypothetical protein